MKLKRRFAASVVVMICFFSLQGSNSPKPEDSSLQRVCSQDDLEWVQEENLRRFIHHLLFPPNFKCCVKEVFIEWHADERENE